MLEFDWENSVGFWICSTSHLIRREMSKRLAVEGITLRQWEVLACLAIRPHINQTQLADFLGIEPPTLAGVLNRMERDGLITRRCCDEDGRRKITAVTDKAQQIWERACEVCHAVRADVVSGVNDEDVQTFLRVCEKMQENLGGLPASGEEADDLIAS
jgi:MarR family transcriptional regulator for hemolysin